MKKLIITASILFIFTLNFCTLAQSEHISGDYEMKVEVPNALIVSKLTLNADGTFLYHEYDNIKERIPQEANKYSKGTWRADKKVISFFSDIDDKYTLDFTATKARFISKSPRDTSDRNIKTSIQFYVSEIFWITGRTLIKIQ
jgi:hypothetical protein